MKEIQVQVNTNNYYIQFSAYVHNVCYGEAHAVECYDEYARVGIEDEYIHVSPDCKFPQRIKLILWKAIEDYAKDNNYSFVCTNCSGDDILKIEKFLNNREYKTVTIVCKKDFKEN